MSTRNVEGVSAKKLADILSTIAEKNPETEVLAFNEDGDLCQITGIYLHKWCDRDLPDLIIAIAFDDDDEYLADEYDSKNLLEIEDIRNATAEDLFPSGVSPRELARAQFEDWRKKHGFTSTPEFRKIIESENPYIALAEYFANKAE